MKLKKISFITTRLLFLQKVIVIVLVFNKISFAEKNYKYFIGYLYNDNIVKRLHIIPLRTSGFVKSYDGQTKLMYFVIVDDDLFEKYNTIWDKFSADINEELDSEPAYNMTDKLNGCILWL